MPSSTGDVAVVPVGYTRTVSNSTSPARNTSMLLALGVDNPVLADAEPGVSGPLQGAVSVRCARRQHLHHQVRRAPDVTLGYDPLSLGGYVQDVRLENILVGQHDVQRRQQHPADSVGVDKVVQKPV